MRCFCRSSRPGDAVNLEAGHACILGSGCWVTGIERARPLQGVDIVDMTLVDGGLGVMLTTAAIDHPQQRWDAYAHVFSHDHSEAAETGFTKYVGRVCLLEIEGVVYSYNERQCSGCATNVTNGLSTVPQGVATSGSTIYNVPVPM